MNTVPTLSWHACYDSSWRGLIVPDAFAHPAKFSRGLAERIIRHGIEQGWWRPGPPGAADVIGDPFGGVGTGGIIAAYNGLGWIGRELEPKFVALAKQNFALHAEKLRALNHPQPYIEHGDSRRFAEIWHQVDGFVLSPPYAESINSRGDGIDWEKTCAKHRGDRTAGRGAIADGYGAAAGQIGSLKAGAIDAVITSPPYADGGQGGGGDFHPDPTRVRDNSNGGSLRAGYGAEPGQIGNLAAGSVDGILTSPPWENCEGSLGAQKFRDPVAFAQQMASASGSGNNHARSTQAALAQVRRDQSRTYGDSEGQLGKTSGETYWQAMRQVYAQCLLALKPRGVMAVVVKDYVKAKQRVPLCDQTLQLLTHLGFEPVCRIHAMLVREHKHECMFNGAVTKRRERKSFFRRLAESKGSPRIDYEEVIVVRNGAA